MAESIMRQKMETWLKQECYDIGRNLLWASKALDTALDSSLDLDIPERVDVARSLIETTVNYAQIVTQRLPLKLFTLEEREKISKARDNIIENLQQAPPKAVQERVVRLMELIEQHLLEKIVECQSGKPGERCIPPTIKFPETETELWALARKLEYEGRIKYGKQDIAFENEVSDKTQDIIDKWVRSLPEPEDAKRWLIAKAAELNIKEY